MIALTAYEVDLRGLRKPSAIFLAGGLLLAHLPATVGLACPMRSLTGVPCPFCGVTTSVRDTFGGHFRAGLAAAPLGLLLIAAAIVVALRLGPARVKLLLPIVIAAVVAEWSFELLRFHVI